MYAAHRARFCITIPPDANVSMQKNEPGSITCDLNLSEAPDPRPCSREALSHGAPPPRALLQLTAIEGSKCTHCISKQGPAHTHVDTHTHIHLQLQSQLCSTSHCLLSGREMRGGGGGVFFKGNAHLRSFCEKQSHKTRLEFLSRT